MSKQQGKSPNTQGKAFPPSNLNWTYKSSYKPFIICLPVYGAKTFREILLASVPLLPATITEQEGRQKSPVL